MTTTMTGTVTPMSRARAAGQYSMTLDVATQSWVLAELLGTLTGLVGAIEDGTVATPCKLADLIDRAVSYGIGKAVNVGDSVSLEVNDLGGTVIGLVDAIRQEPSHGATVIDVELPDGRIFPQSARFVKPVR